MEGEKGIAWKESIDYMLKGLFFFFLILIQSTSQQYSYNSALNQSA